MTEVKNEKQDTERGEWTTEQMTQDFNVQGFGGYCVCVVRRKSDNVLGSLMFDGNEHPRIYRDFTPHTR